MKKANIEMDYFPFLYQSSPKSLAMISLLLTFCFDSSTYLFSNNSLHIVAPFARITSKDIDEDLLA